MYVKNYFEFQMMGELGLEAGEITQEVGELVEHVWREAVGELENILAVDIYSIKLEQVQYSSNEFGIFLCTLTVFVHFMIVVYGIYSTQLIYYIEVHRSIFSAAHFV